MMNPATDQPADALVFFGATGDLAYKKIFPSLQAMVRRGHLDVPVIGVAKAGWTLEQLRERARDSVEKHGGLDAKAFGKLCSLLRYVDGDYADASTFAALRKQLFHIPEAQHEPEVEPHCVADDRWWETVPFERNSAHLPCPTTGAANGAAGAGLAFA